MGSEIIQFGAALVLFVGILIGSYWFVYAPSRRRRNSGGSGSSGNSGNSGGASGTSSSGGSGNDQG